MWQQLNILPPKNNQIIDFSLNGKNFLITSINDELFAVKDLCPHEEVKISLGCIANSRLKCSLHGFSFDLKTGKCDNPDVDNIQTYPLKIKNGNMFVHIANTE